MKKIIFFLILFFWPSLLFATPIKSKYEIYYFPETHLLKGRAIFELPKEGLYEFIKGENKITEILLNKKPIEVSSHRSSFKIFNGQKNGTLIISFEGNIVLKSTLYPQVIEGYLPYPKELFFFEISLNSPDEKNFPFLIPHEEKEENDQDGKIILRITKPLTALPPLIYGNFNLRTISFEEGELIFLLPRSLSERVWDAFEHQVIKGVNEYPMREILFAFKKTYFIPSNFKRIYPLVNVSPSIFEGNLQTFLESQVEQTLIYGLNFVNPPFFEGLKTYLVSYYLSDNKKEFRKKLLLKEEDKNKAFFFLYEKIDIIGEKRFEEIFKNYIQLYLFNGSQDGLFQAYISKNLEYTTTWDYTNFDKALLRGEVKLKYIENEKKYNLILNLSQQGQTKTFSLEVLIETERGPIKKKVWVGNKEVSYNYYLSEKPIKVILDPEYKIFRKLSSKEIPLTWEHLFLSQGTVYLTRKHFLPLYKELLNLLRESNYVLKSDEIGINNLPKENVVFLERLPVNFHLSVPKDGIYFKILPHPFSPEHFFAFIKIGSFEEIKKIFFLKEEIKDAQEFHIRKGVLTFVNKSRPTDGIQLEIKDDKDIKTAFGVKIDQLKTLENILPEIIPAQVILIGESHNEYSHHLFQLEVIKGLYQFFGNNVVIGMEMVQRPFQKYLDEFIAGKVSEEKLLEQIEYYDRWKFDYRLYRDIFLFAKEKGIRILALDLPQEIVKKVFKGGLHSLSLEDRNYLPEMDLNAPEYKELLRRVFFEHNFSNETNFEHFFQAQVLRDEAMAEEIFNFVRKNPEKKLIVLVGKNHILNRLGIPEALNRRKFTDYKTILLGKDVTLSATLADYWFPLPSLDYESSPSLGVIVEETQEGLKIKEVLKGTLAEELKLSPGDIILKVDGRPINKISDLKLILTFKEKGSVIILQVKREITIIERKGIVK
ncbi:MAG: ChaN family lipoprotein [Caldimicrobium sp.]